MSAQSFATPSEWLQQIAWAHAPVILQETNWGPNVAMENHLLRVDFDGNPFSADNFPSAVFFRYQKAAPAVYYSIVETVDSYYIGYYFYHATDGGADFGGTKGDHEHDLEGYWVHVAKEPGPYGVETVGLTLAHGGFQPTYNPGVFTPPGPLVTAAREFFYYYSRLQTLHWLDPYAGIMRPVLMIRKGTHSTYPAQNLTPGGQYADVGCSRRTDNVASDGLCGIYPNDDGGSNHDYAVGYHGDANLITYWPWVQPPCSVIDGCSDVVALPPGAAIGTTWYNLISFVDSPLWRARNTPNVMYRPHGSGIPETMPQGEQGLSCFIESIPTAKCGAQPPWAWGMSHCELFNPCWERFGEDSYSYRTADYPNWAHIDAGSILDSPRVVHWTLWHGLSYIFDVDIYNPFRLNYSPPTLAPPVFATIGGLTMFNWSNSTGNFTANIAGGKAPYTYVWSGDFGQMYGTSISFPIDHPQTLYLDVYDSDGWHYAAQVNLEFCEGLTCLIDGN